MRQDTKSKVIKKNDKSRDQIIENKMKIHNIIHNQKEYEINRENSILFNKLMQISMGKSSQLPLQRNRKSKAYISQSPMRTLPQLKTQRDNPHSLNYVNRKREKERIDKENLKLAAKLVTEQSELKRSKLIQDYQLTKEYK